MYQMKESFYSEASHQLLFTVFDSKKFRKSGYFRVHHHAEPELGFILSGNGEYQLGSVQYAAGDGDLFLIRSGEQHCMPAVATEELTMFNIYITPYFLWNICADFIDSRHLHAFVCAELSVCHRFRGFSDAMLKIRALADKPEENRFRIRSAVTAMLTAMAEEMELPAESEKIGGISGRLADVQRAVAFIDAHFTEPLTLCDIARAANMSRSTLSGQFKLVMGIPPYEYLLIARVEHAVTLLRESELSVVEAAQESGFENLANFNKAFKRITGMTPRDCRKAGR